MLVRAVRPDRGNERARPHVRAIENRRLRGGNGDDHVGVFGRPSNVRDGLAFQTMRLPAGDREALGATGIEIESQATRNREDIEQRLQLRVGLSAATDDRQDLAVRPRQMPGGQRCRGGGAPHRHFDRIDDGKQSAVVGIAQQDGAADGRQPDPRIGREIAIEL